VVIWGSCITGLLLWMLDMRLVSHLLLQQHRGAVSGLRDLLIVAVDNPFRAA
jgi:hypothetical protein